MVRELPVEIDGRRVRCLEAGAGRPAVLLHAFPLSADMWRPQLEHVPAGWRILAPDLRGFGPSAGGRATTLDDMADDVLALLDVLGVGTAALGGLSMGGYVTFALLRKAPERCTALILANTRAAADSADGRAARDRMSALVRAGGPPAVADEMLPKLLGATSRASRPELEPLVRGLIVRNSPEGIDGAIHAMKGRPDSVALLPGIGVPVLLVAGDEDVLVPGAELEAMHRLLPRSRLVTIRGAGHLSNLETPHEFSESLRVFLDALPLADGSGAGERRE